MSEIMGLGNSQISGTIKTVYFFFSEKKWRQFAGAIIPFNPSQGRISCARVVLCTTDCFVKPYQA